jgi:hypothetical protein
LYDGGIGVQLESLHPDGGIGGDGGGEPEEPGPCPPEEGTCFEGDMPDVVNGRMRFTKTPNAKANNNLCIIISSY